MLSIGKLGRGAEGYYLRSVAAGVEDYDLGSGEATGYWVGRGAALLGLSGPVQVAYLDTTLDGRHARGRRSMLWIRRADRLPGFDLPFSAPMGVPLLFALSDPRTSRVVGIPTIGRSRPVALLKGRDLVSRPERLMLG